MIWLDEFDAKVLFRLWQHRDDGFGDHVRAKDLRNMLGPTTPGDPSRGQVTRSLDKMKSGGLLEWKEKLPGDATGPKPVGFRIADDNLMTRPATAVMLFEVHSDSAPPTVESELVTSLLPIGFRHKGSEIMEQYLKDQISFCAEKGYLERSPLAGGSDFGLKRAERLDAELAFIDKLRRFAHVSRILWKSTAKDKFHGKDESTAFNEFLTDLNLLAKPAFKNWLSFANTEFIPTASPAVEFKAGAALSIIEKLKLSLSDFRG